NACTEGWANERRELQTQIQRLREQLVQQRHTATDSITQLRLSLDAVHAEQDAERTKLQTQLSLQRAYLQAEIVCQ
ncbi:cyp102A1, partial [Symbiodinium sp. CCMP2456]